MKLFGITVTLILLLAIGCLGGTASAGDPPVARSAVTRLPPVSPQDSAPVLPSVEHAAYFDTPDEGMSLEERIAEIERQLAESRIAAEEKAKAARERPTVQLTTQLQADSLHFDQDAANQATVGDIENGAVFRRARVGWVGEYLLTEYRIEFDFALSGRPHMLDVWVGWNEVPYLGRLKVGHYFEPFSLERYTPNRFMTFMERSLIDQAFAPARNLGVMAGDTNADQSATWALGLIRTNSDVFGDDLGDGGEKAVTGRVTWLPWYDEPAEGRYLLHLGAGYSFRDADADSAQFRAQPEIRSQNTSPPTPFFVDTSSIPAHSYQLFGLEAALVNGPLSLQWEYMAVPVARRGGADPTFQGTYLYASYFLTGEHRPYQREFGTFDRVMPFEEFFLVRTARDVSAGWGAWELAARVSYLDLNSAGVLGGELTELTAGLNWYMNPYTKVMINYAHALLDRQPVGASSANIFGMRASFDF
ncbi:MAG: hypothetical protein HY000_17665 [Planctomycetes bacterium]|nr:hypothetical protein [Planctomycetota bacterium]